MDHSTSEERVAFLQKVRRAFEIGEIDALRAAPNSLRLEAREKRDASCEESSHRDYKE